MEAKRFCACSSGQISCIQNWGREARKCDTLETMGDVVGGVGVCSSRGKVNRPGQCGSVGGASGRC